MTSCAKTRASGYIDAPDYWVDQTNWETIRRSRKYFIANSQTVDPSWLESETYWGLRLLRAALDMDTPNEPPQSAPPKPKT